MRGRFPVGRESAASWRRWRCRLGRRGRRVRPAGTMRTTGGVPGDIAPVRDSERVWPRRRVRPERRGPVWLGGAKSADRPSPAVCPCRRMRGGRRCGHGLGGRRVRHRERWPRSALWSARLPPAVWERQHAGDIGAGCRVPACMWWSPWTFWWQLPRSGEQVRGRDVMVVYPLGGRVDGSVDDTTRAVGPVRLP